MSARPDDRPTSASAALGRIAGAPGSSAPLALAEKLRDAIMGLAPPAGTKLFTIGEVVHQTGHGAGVVREALSLLSSEGIIEVRQGKQGGVYAKHPNIDVLSLPLRTLILTNQMTDETVIEARQQLEGACARLAAQRRDDAFIHRLQGSVSRMTGLTASPEEFAHEAMEFHTILCESSGNSLLAHINAALREIFHQPSALVRYCSSDLRAAVRAHRRIVDAIASGDGDRAHEAVMLHIDAFAATADRIREEVLSATDRDV